MKSWQLLQAIVFFAVSRKGEIHVRLMQVYAVKLVKAACFYGYNPNPEPFLRISLCAPEPVAIVYRPKRCRRGHNVLAQLMWSIQLSPQSCGCYYAHIPKITP